MSNHEILTTTDATAMAERVRSGDVTPVELVQAAIDRSEAVNPKINALIHERFERALAEAATVDTATPFAGVPIVLKDYDGPMAGEPYHAGMAALKSVDYREAEHSHMVRRLLNAGFIVIGRTNTPELGLQVTTEPTAYGPTRNPWNTDHTVGGSSGGSAAAVAAGIVPVGHAGDGGGSIRVPASACGLVGLKPARGRVSMGPQEAENWAGFVSRHVVTRSVRDSATILDVLAGREIGDPYAAVPPTRPFAEAVTTPPDRLRIGVMTQMPGGTGTVDASVAAAAEDTARRLEELGHDVEHAHPSALDEGGVIEAMKVILPVWVDFEIRLWSERAGITIDAGDVEPSTWAYVEQARHITAADYLAATDSLQAWTRRLHHWWEDFDLLLSPTLPKEPVRIGDIPASTSPENPSGLNAELVPFTVPFNISGQPAISLPVHISEDGLPIGVQLAGGPDSEELLLSVAAQLEAVGNWVTAAPA